jgi:hypothetical protein
MARVVRRECVGCAAIWQVLPAFIARQLWRTWRVVERALRGAQPVPTTIEGRRWPPVPERTRRRWRVRWLRPVQFLAQVLATCGEAVWSALARRQASDRVVAAGRARPAESARLEHGDRRRYFDEAAARTHERPYGTRVRLSARTIESWYRAWRRGGFAALFPGDRRDRGVSRATKTRLFVLPATTAAWPSWTRH